MAKHPRPSRACSLAAKKGWATRHARARARSLAAKKGWATRKKKKGPKRAKPFTLKSQRDKSRAKRPAVVPAVAKIPRPKARAEFAVSADYQRAKRHGSAVSVQLAILAPEDSTKDDIESAIQEKLETDADPDGFSIKIIDWRGRNRHARIRQDEDWRAFKKPLRMADLSIRKNRKT